MPDISGIHQHELILNIKFLQQTVLIALCRTHKLQVSPVRNGGYRNIESGRLTLHHLFHVSSDDYYVCGVLVKPSIQMAHYSHQPGRWTCFTHRYQDLGIAVVE